MIKAYLILKDDNLRDSLKSKIKLFLGSGSERVTFVEENYIKDYASNDILVIFYQIENAHEINSAKELKEYTHANCIVFLSKDESLVFQSLNVKPLQFIRLDNFDEDFKNMIEILLAYIKNIDTVVTIKSGTATIRLNVKNIIFIESYGHYLVMHCTTGEYRVREKLTTIIEQINNPRFIRAHKSYIINVDFVIKVLPGKLKLRNELEIPMGRNFKEKVIQGITSSENNFSYK